VKRTADLHQHHSTRPSTTLVVSITSISNQHPCEIFDEPSPNYRYIYRACIVVGSTRTSISHQHYRSHSGRKSRRSWFPPLSPHGLYRGLREIDLVPAPTVKRPPTSPRYLSHFSHSRREHRSDISNIGEIIEALHSLDLPTSIGTRTLFRI
jgi:hypothetical protein